MKAERSGYRPMNILPFPRRITPHMYAEWRDTGTLIDEAADAIAERTVTLPVRPLHLQDRG